MYVDLKEFFVDGMKPNFIVEIISQLSNLQYFNFDVLLYTKAGVFNYMCTSYVLKCCDVFMYRLQQQDPCISEDQDSSGEDPQELR